MTNVNKTMDQYFDSLGLIGHLRPDMPGFDFGDSAREVGTYYTALTLRELIHMSNAQLPYPGYADYYRAIGHLQIEPGIFVRHPQSTDAWHRDPKEFSRDQQTAIELSMVVGHDKKNLASINKNHLLRFGKYQNADWGLWAFALRARGLGYWGLWPTIVLLDLSLVVNSIIRCVSGLFNKDDVANDINHTQSLIVCNQFYWTPTASIAFYIYKWFRPYPNVVDKNVNSIQSCWDYYYRHPENPPMNEVMRPVLKEYFD